MTAAPAPGSIVMSVAALSDVGPIREVNEDEVRVAALGSEAAHPAVARVAVGPGQVLGVYDGCGGASDGRVASAQAARVVHAVLAEAPLADTEDALRDQLARAVAQANRAIHAAGQGDPRLRGMGTTATVAALVDATLVIAQAGDSRAYLLRGRRLLQLTRDDTLDEQMRLTRPDLTPEEIAALPQHVLVKALGLLPEVAPTMSRVILRRGDVVLLCTDGLWAVVGAPQMRRILLRQREPGVACRLLIDAALAAPATDNVTAVVARFDGEGLRPPIRGEVVG